MIRLEHLGKRYPGQPQPAVDDLSLDVPAGEIVILVGPSGCGKTTTMKLINRLIEPTSGRIFLEGEDVTNVNPDKLRRRIGYAIQQVGLFPHLTVGSNIATVPKMLGWDRDRVRSRTDELLDLVGMDPDTYRDRYPKQLSGGQQQRIGVARALSADPDVMLMDEPFGAIDPITREKLQDEFLRVQEDIKKTIIFVTHDIDEAIKMGDRIVILSESAHVAQYDTPAQILTNPASEFVEDFVGSGATVKRLTLTRAAEAPVADWPTIPAAASADDKLAAIRRANVDYVLMLDEEQRPVGWLPADVSSSDGELLARGLPILAPIRPKDTLYDALDAMLRANSTVAAVTDADGRYRGVLDLDTLRTLIHAESGGTKGARSGAPATARENVREPR
jgi:osmoprotectant transport system ATP-binding protein